MRISELDTLTKEQIVSHNAEKSSFKETGLAFKRQISDAQSGQYEKQIRALTEDIFKQGEIVAKRADIKELQKYRELITNLINETVSNSYAFKKENSFDGRGRFRTHAVIQKINAKLDSITQEILKEEKDNVAILNQVDDIRGLLVDLFL